MERPHFLNQWTICEICRIGRTWYQWAESADELQNWRNRDLKVLKPPSRSTKHNVFDRESRNFLRKQAE